jgi:hypothetical protein
MVGVLSRGHPERSGRTGVLRALPTTAETAALRVPPRVREALRIDVYVVSEAGEVRRARER